ncbi:MAG: hypothetical protein LBK06_00295 [Planctomycetaceae bacterium]|nr:hypothetical protein [Planctomycetaceae bacterium]
MPNDRTKTQFSLRTKLIKYNKYAKAVLKFAKQNTVAQQREAVTRGRSLLPYRLRYNFKNLLQSIPQTWTNSETRSTYCVEYIILPFVSR